MRQSDGARTWSWSLHAHTAGATHAEILATCRTVGAGSVEIFYSMLEADGEAELDAAAREYAAAGVRVDSFHLPFGPPETEITNFYEVHRRRAADSVVRWCGRMARFRTRILVVHPAHGLSGVDTEGVDSYLRQLGRSLETILPALEEHGIDLALENMLPGPNRDRFGSRPEHFELIRARFGHPRLKFCLDTGHALVSLGRKRMGEFFDAMGEELAAFHLADNAGDRDSHLAPGRGLVDWRTVFGRMLEMRYAHGACIEAPPFAPGPPYAHAAWRRMLDELDALVAEAAAGTGTD